MEIKIGTKHILTVLQVISWIIFIGLCVETGGIFFNAVFAHFNPTVSKYFWYGVDFSALYAYDIGHFFTQILLMTIASVMKTLIFYLIIKLFYDKKFSLSKPFDPKVIGVVFNIAYLCLGAGFFSLWGAGYANWIKSKGIPMPDTEHLGISGGDVWLFMAVVLAVVGQVFKKGTALQNESDLTV